MIKRNGLLMLALSVGLTSTVLAEDWTACEAKGTNGMVTVVLCPPGLDDEAWQQAGRAACGERKPCGAWIWDDVETLPGDIPDSHDKLAPEDVRNARAVWMNERQELYLIEKETGKPQ